MRGRKERKAEVVVEVDAGGRRKRFLGVSVARRRISSLAWLIKTLIVLFLFHVRTHRRTTTKDED